MNVVSFTVPGAPQGKGRARFGRAGGQVRVFTPARTVAYESLVSLAAQQAMAGAGPFQGAVALDLTLVHAVPKSWPKKRRQEALDGRLRPICRPDMDNVVKAIGDGGNGVLWADDSQIAILTATRRYGDTPAVHAVVAGIDINPA